MQQQAATDAYEDPSLEDLRAERVRDSTQRQRPSHPTQSSCAYCGALTSPLACSYCPATLRAQAAAARVAAGMAKTTSAQERSRRIAAASAAQQLVGEQKALEAELAETERQLARERRAAQRTKSYR